MPQASTKVPVTPFQIPNAIVPGRAGAPAIPIPLNSADVDALLARRDELSNMLSSASSRRTSLSRELPRSKAGPDQTGIEARISQLDARIITIESDLADVGRALSAAPAGLRTTSSTSPPRPYGQPNAGQVTGIAIVGIIFVLMPLSIAFARLMLRRAAHPPAPQVPKDVSDRLERMEQGIEAVALEVERIGEGQRFVTQLMSDRAQRAALPEGIPRS